MDQTGSKISIDPRSLLPSVDELMRSPEAGEFSASVGGRIAAELCRRSIEGLRENIEDLVLTDLSRERLFEVAMIEFKALIAKRKSLSQTKVVNATGVVIHTNLGRAPLSAAALDGIVRSAGYSNVEFDLTSGKRGLRGGLAEDMLTELTGAESALIVNNCAAAALLVLSVFARGKEVIVSRGELVEIGGDFRIPDVLERSGASLREVGTTNRTKILDHEKAIGEKTAMIMRVHPSNYRIVGFTSSPSNAEIAALAKKRNILFFEDAGSGAMFDMAKFGLPDEPVIPRSIQDGADLVAFSGDKLLGGPQSGIIVGKRDLIDKLRRDPLFRALRPNKLIYAAMEGTLAPYLRETHLDDIPVLRMLTASTETLFERATSFKSAFETEFAKSAINLSVVKGLSAIGGGAAAGIQPETALIVVECGDLSADSIAARMRNSDVPVIGRIDDGRFMLDLRTVSVSEEPLISRALRTLQN